MQRYREKKKNRRYGTMSWPWPLPACCRRRQLRSSTVLKDLQFTHHTSIHHSCVGMRSTSGTSRGSWGRTQGSGWKGGSSSRRKRWTPVMADEPYGLWTVKTKFAACLRYVQ
jgi:hypothetical protein